MIIDFHTHIFPPQFRNARQELFAGEKAFEILYNSPQAKLVGAEDLLRNMDNEGIDRSVIFGFPWEKKDHFWRHNNYIIEAVQKYPDRLTGLCCFSPLAPDGPEEVKRCLEAGLSGVGELAVYGDGLTAGVTGAMKDVMALCSQFDVPFLLHTNEPVGHNYPGKAPMTLAQIYHFIKMYPLNRIILAHWGGGLLFYALMKKEVKEVLKKVWFDTAASPYLYTPDIYRVAGELIGFEKILFGSDYPLLKPSRYFKEMESANISPHAMKQISGANGAQFLGLRKK